MTQQQALTQLAHTDGMLMTHRRAANTMRKAAIRTTEGTAVVWSIKASTLKQTEVLIYTGHEKLTQMTDEDLVTQHTWLEREQHNTATRDAIDKLCTEVEKKDMWYAMWEQG
jgi:hypothetical protein